jgi:hypothetical protein
MSRVPSADEATDVQYSDAGALDWTQSPPQGFAERFAIPPQLVSEVVPTSSAQNTIGNLRDIGLLQPEASFEQQRPGVKRVGEDLALDVGELLG